MIIPNTKRHPNYENGPINYFEVITGLQRSYGRGALFGSHVSDRLGSSREELPVNMIILLVQWCQD